MTRFATMLNEITPPGLERKVAPTDCRLRPDQHALEEGIYDQVITCAPAFASQAKQPLLWYDKVGQAGCLYCYFLTGASLERRWLGPDHIMKLLSIVSFG